MGAGLARRPLAEAATQRTLEAEQRVHSALRGMDSDGATVTFAAVAERARVSRAFLYQQAELRARLRAALDEGQRQREEIHWLREELAHGRVRELDLDRWLRRP